MESDLSDTIIGLKQSIKAVKSGKALKAFVAEDADFHVREPFLTICRENGVPVEYYKTCKELGSACKIDVGAAVAVVQKDDASFSNKKE